MNIALIGANGRMGRAVIEQCRDGVHSVVLEVGRKSQSEDFSQADVIIDFSTPSGLQAGLEIAVQSGLPLVSGTTGLDADGEAQLDRAAQSVPVFHASNMSRGMALLRHLSEQAAAALPPETDVEILEHHHRAKVDAPSGSALSLGESVAKGRGQNLSDHRAPFDRNGERALGDIGFAVLRGGDVVGEHSVMLHLAGERLELTHRAGSRDIFAAGAIAAAEWLCGQKPGRYDMQALLGL